MAEAKYFKSNAFPPLGIA